MTMFVSLPILIGFAMIAEPFVIFFFTEKWLPAVVLIQWLSLSAAIYPISVLNLNILNARGRSDLYLKIDLIKLPMTVLILFTTVPFGIKAVVIGQFITRLISFFINAYYPGKLYGYGPIEQIKDMWKILISTSFMALGAWFVNFTNPISDIIISIVVCLCIYIGTSFLLKVESLNEIQLIINDLRKKSKPPCSF